jgi:hypothetical protein
MNYSPSSQIPGQLGSPPSRPQFKLNSHSGSVNGVVKRKIKDSGGHLNAKKRGLPWMDVTDGEVSPLITNKVVYDRIVSPGRHARKLSKNNQGSGGTSSKFTAIQEQRRQLPIAKGVACK